MTGNGSYAVQVVKELQGGALQYPRNIPDDRGSTALILQIIIIILFWGACNYLALRNRDLSDTIKYSWYCLTTNILLLISAGLLWRICNLCEELRHVHSRYDDNIGTVFTAALQYNTLTIVVIALCVASFVGMVTDVGSPLEYLWSFGPEPYVLSLICSMLIVRLMNVDQSRLDTALKLLELKGLDYGSSMAYSYYYGYLHIVLPSQGDVSKGLYGNIEEYEARENVTVPVKKLFILIPTSLRTPPDLREASYNWMEKAKSLTSVIKDRAGIRDRQYHNTVYVIHKSGVRSGADEDLVYVVTEGATPLQTFYEVLQHSGKDSTSYYDFRKEIAGSFFRTLRHIIRSKPEVRDLCELVYYEDFDPDQNRVNVAKILLDKIREQDH